MVIYLELLIYIIGAFVFDQDVNDAVRLLKRDRSADVREHVFDIQTFPMNLDSSADLVLADFVQKMRDAISRRVVSENLNSEIDTMAESRASMNQWMERRSTSSASSAEGIVAPAHQEEEAQEDDQQDEDEDLRAEDGGEENGESPEMKMEEIQPKEEYYIKPIQEEN